MRGELVESRHEGYAVLLDRFGQVSETFGAVDHVYPRSAVKPAQAGALVRLGFGGTDRELALAAASHHGEPAHLEVVNGILAAAGLDERALQTPPDVPIDGLAAQEWLRSGRLPQPIAMNCSGKHAAMLATCVRNGWSTTNYCDPVHPMQVAVRAEIAMLSGSVPDHATVDGCGAPLYALPLVGLARMVRNSVVAAAGEPVRIVADAMRAEPWYVGGTTSDVTALMRAVPGLLAKNGAEGVAAAALADGRALAVKIADGSDAARRVVLAGLLLRLGLDAPEVVAMATAPVFGGGQPVGELRCAGSLHS